MSFAHLHVHTEYSLLDGFSNIKKLTARAREMGMPAVAITDHGTMFGVIEFYHAAMAAGVKPIIGLEAYLAARTMKDMDPHQDKRSSHLLLLAENDTGYKNLLQIASAAQLEGFYYSPRIDKAYLAAHAEGLIAFSGCLSAEVPRLLADGDVDSARTTLDWYYQVFGRENFFLELQQHAIPVLKDVNRHLVELGKHFGSQFVATNDTHYIDPQDARLQDIMLAIQTGAILSDPNRMCMDGDDYYLRPPEEMARLFAEVPDSISNTLLIAERCNVNLEVEHYRLPHFEVPEGFTPATYLRQLCQDGVRFRYGDRAETEEIQQRLNYELQVIGRMGFDAYFLIVWDLCRHAREHNIWYNARGSGAGSIVAYALRISLIDPLEHNLLFERFLNPDRTSMPDIDMDFPDDRRSDMLSYAVNKYGQDKVSQIITFGTLGARAALRDVARVKDIPLPEVDRLAKMVATVQGKQVTLKLALEEVPDLKQAYDNSPHIRDLIDTASAVEGVVRNAGTHAAGVVISDKPLVEYLPLHRPTSNAEETPVKTVTQFEMGILDKLKMLKVDFLGLATLTIMQKACNLIQERHGIRYDLTNIPIDDPETYKFLSAGNTLGVFQLEGAGMTKNLVQMKPTSLEHVIAMVALFRPGPMQFIQDYIDRMHGKAEAEYRHPSLEPIFRDTYGIPIYQEQIMRAAIELAGYTPGESDELRSAISKKKNEEIARHHKKFVEGAAAKGMDREVAEQIFQDWDKFARYGFNKSHAADYGYIAVQTGFLKLHYPAEYMTALLSVSKHETEKVALYANDARQLGVPVLPPDVSTSEWDFFIEPLDGRDAIRFGLGAIKNVGEASAQEIVRARREGGAFKDLNDLAARADLRIVGKRALESLIQVGALDAFGTRTAMLEVLERIMAVSSSHFRAAEAGQLSLFGATTGVQDSIELPLIPDAGSREKLNWEREMMGVFMSEHPLTPYIDDIRLIVTHYANTLAEAQAEEKSRVAGMVTSIRPYQTKKGDMMGWVTIEDLTGTIELVLFPRTWNKYQFALEMSGIIVAEGRIDAKSSPPKIIVDTLRTQIKVTEPAQIPLQPAAPSSKPARRQEPPAAAGSVVADKPPAQERSYHADHDEGMPPPPEDPPEWAGYTPVVRQVFVAPEAQEPPRQAPSSTPEVTAAPKAQEPPRQAPVSAPAAGNMPAPLTATLVIPPPVSARSEDHASQVAIVTLHPSGDAERDIRRISRLHGTFISYPGRDRFAFRVYEQGRGHLIEFPNDSTQLCAELLKKIKEAVGDENVRVEPVTYQ